MVVVGGVQLGVYGRETEVRTRQILSGPRDKLTYYREEKRKKRKI